MPKNTAQDAPAAAEDEGANLYARVPQELHEWARIQAIRERRSVQALVREALELYRERVEKVPA